LALLGGGVCPTMSESGGEKCWHANGVTRDSLSCAEKSLSLGTRFFMRRVESAPVGTSRLAMLYDFFQNAFSM